MNLSRSWQQVIVIVIAMIPGTLFFLWWHPTGEFIGNHTNEWIEIRRFVAALSLLFGMAIVFLLRRMAGNSADQT
jgi:hypothetical protein